VNHTGVAQDTLGSGGLTGVDVCGNTEVALKSQVSHCYKN
jgi:hypothetical protein